MIGFQFHFPLSSHKSKALSVPPLSSFLLSVIYYSFVPFNLNCPSRKHNFHFKDFMSTFQAAEIFLFNLRQLMQGFEIQNVVERKMMSYFQNFLLLIFQHIFYKTGCPRSFECGLSKLSWVDLVQRTRYEILGAVHQQTCDSEFLCRYSADFLRPFIESLSKHSWYRTAVLFRILRWFLYSCFRWIMGGRISHADIHSLSVRHHHEPQIIQASLFSLFHRVPLYLREGSFLFLGQNWHHVCVFWMYA